MDQLGFLIADFTIVAIILASGFLAATRGFIKEVLAVAAWISAAAAAVLLFPYIKDFTRDLVSQEILADGITICIIFVVTLVVVSLISQPISARVRKSNMGPANRILGFGFGVVRGALIVAIGYLLVTWVVAVNDQPNWLLEAKLLPIIDQAGQWLLNLVPGAFRENAFLGFVDPVVDTLASGRLG
jgi:membrane protein required for colicin V production